MRLHLWGIDHRRDTSNIRAQLHPLGASRRQFIESFLTAGFLDFVPLFTCNRTEFYTSARDSFADTSTAWRHAFQALGLPTNTYYQGYHLEGKAALRHLFRVASSLESLVIGETQILGQLKEAIAWIKQEKLPLDVSLERVFMRAFEIAKRIRTETQIGEKSVSVGSLGLTRLQSLEQEFPIQKLALVGRSEIIRSVATWAQKNRPAWKIIWANRSPEKLKEIPEAAGSEIVGLEDFLTNPPHVEVIFTATKSSEPVFRRCFFERKTHPLVVFDFAEPADVERGELPANIRCIRMEDLQEEAAANAAERSKAVLEAEKLVESALRDFFIESKRLPLIRDYSTVEERLSQDLERAWQDLEQSNPSELNPRLRAWAEKLVKRQLFLSREHLKDVLERVPQDASLGQI